MKKINIIFAFLIILESFIIGNFVYKTRRIEKNEVSKMNYQISQIKENVNDVINEKDAVDVLHTLEQCIVFLDDIEEYKFKYNNVDIEKIVRVVQEYRNLILEIDRVGFNEDFENKIYKIKKCLDVIDIKKDFSVVEFNDNLNKCNDVRE